MLKIGKEYEKTYRNSFQISYKKLFKIYQIQNLIYFNYSLSLTFKENL